MQLKLSNIGKIEEAAIDIDGITVIAGENNAGKSTIGKLLFAVFNSMNNMDEKILEEKRNKIYQTIVPLLQNYHGKRPDNYTLWVRRRNVFATNVANNIMGISAATSNRTEMIWRRIYSGTSRAVPFLRIWKTMKAFCKNASIN